MSNRKTFICSLFLIHSTLFCSLEVTFLDVGQGNCTLVKHNDFSPLIVDCGSLQYDHRGNAFKKNQITFLVDQMDSSQVSKNFMLVVSHPDNDHYNWIAELLSQAAENSILAEKVWLGGKEDQYSDKFVKKLKQVMGVRYNTHVLYPSSANDTDLTIDIASSGNIGYTIMPSKKCVNKAKEANRASLVVQISFFGKNILLTGDATKETFDHINAYVQLSDILILQASHHGADSEGKDRCNDEEWIKQLKPAFTVVSSGRRKDFLHPRSSTVDSCLKHTSEFLSDEPWHPLYVGCPDEKIPKESRHFLQFVNGYAALITKKAVFGTLALGTITFVLTIDNHTNDVRCIPSFHDIHKFRSLKAGSLAVSLLGPRHPFLHQEIKSVDYCDLSIDDSQISDKESFCKVIDFWISLNRLAIKEILLDSNEINSSDSLQKIGELLGKFEVRDFSMLDNSISDDANRDLRSIWNNRGLHLPII